MNLLKRRIIMVLLFGLLITAFILITPMLYDLICIMLEPHYDYENAKKYETRMVSLLEESEIITVDQVFDFAFSRAFVIEETYLGGDSFAEKYGLDISVEEMMENSIETSRRIVFVDDSGEFVYEFRFMFGEPLSTKIDGFIIYPDTKIKQVDSFSEQKDSIGIEFMVDEEDYLVPDVESQKWFTWIRDS